MTPKKIVSIRPAPKPCQILDLSSIRGQRGDALPGISTRVILADINIYHTRPRPSRARVDLPGLQAPRARPIRNDAPTVSSLSSTASTRRSTRPLLESQRLEDVNVRREAPCRSLIAHAWKTLIGKPRNHSDPGQRLAVEPRTKEPTPLYSALPLFMEQNVVPPPYSKKDQLKDLVMAELCFRFGFLFPPLWFVGSLYLRVGINERDDHWLHGYRPEHRHEVKRLYRSREKQAARRCLAALGLLLLIGGVILIVLSVTQRHKE